jgi:hypothetical protein
VGDPVASMLDFFDIVGLLTGVKTGYGVFFVRIEVIYAVVGVNLSQNGLSKGDEAVKSFVRCRNILNSVRKATLCCHSGIVYIYNHIDTPNSSYITKLSNFHCYRVVRVRKALRKFSRELRLTCFHRPPFTPVID